jgi:predicted lipoprotein with Yx(FWY)xxD motif
VIPQVLARPSALLLVLAALALVARATIVGRPADARAGVRATSGTGTSTTLTVGSTRFGRILFGGRRRAPSMRSLGIDGGGRSRCYGARAKAWPYFAKGCSLAGKGVRQSLLGTSRRRDARRQVSYNGRPLYYYVGDKKPGQVLCQNVDEFGAPGWSSARTVARCV